MNRQRALSGRVITLSPVTRYGLAIAVAIGAILLRLALDPVWGSALPFMMFFPAIMLSAWVGGFGPGIVTTLMCTEAAEYFWLDPGHFSIRDRGDLVALSIFALVGVAISALNEAWRRGTASVAESEERLKVTLTSIGDAVIATDDQGRVTRLNAVGEALTGWTQSDAQGRRLEDVFVIINEQTREPVESPVHRVLRDGVITGLANHTVLVSKGGREIPIDDSAAPIRTEDGALAGVVMVFRDVTDRRRIEQERVALLERERAAHVSAQRAAEELRHLQTLTDTALSSLDSDTLIRSLLARVRTALKSDTATMLMLNGDGTHLIPVASDGLEAEVGAEIQVPVEGGLAGRIAHSDGPVILDDLTNTDVVSPILRGRIRSVVGVPLKVGNRLLGVLHAGASSPRQFTAADAHLLSLAADRIVVGIERARLHETERSARREAEGAIEQLRVALEAGRMGTWEYALRAGTVKWSPGLEAIHGFSPGGFPGTFEAFQTEIYPADRDMVCEAISQAIEHGRDHHIEYRIVRSDGRVRWVEGRGQLFKDADGRPERMMGVCTDITERKHAEEKFRLAVQAAPAAMIMVDPRGTIQLVNALTEQLLGYRREELVGQSVERLVPPRFAEGHAGFRASFVSDARPRPMGEGRDLYALRKDGTEVPVEIGLSPVETADGLFVLAAVTDITERKRTATLLQQAFEAERVAKREAEHANELKDQFLATVSHELRAPLNAVLGWADMLRGNVLEGARRQKALDAVYINARRQSQLIDDLLDVARIVSGKMRIERTAVSLQAVIRGALDVTEPSAQAKRIGVSVDIDDSIGMILGDAARLQQIVWNLLTNAVKFTPEGGAIDVRARRAGEFVEIAVADNGSGIAPEFLPWAFEPFRQADASTTRVHGGLGLGLAIVKHLVEAHDGTVNCESAGEGHGATFTVRLPIVAVYLDEAGSDDTARPRPSRMSSAPTSTALSDVTVLVVDDDAESRELLTVTLESYGARVVTAASATEAEQALDNHRIDVLLSDIAMPGKDGYSLIRAIRAREVSGRPRLPAAALTSFTRDDDRERARQAGFEAHFSKPIDARSLVDAVAALAHGVRMP